MAEQNEMQPNEKYKGVKGWLLLFCIILTVINPALTVFVYFADFPGFNALTFFGIVDTFWMVLVTLFGMYAGISLWTVRPNAVKTAKIYLLAIAGYAVFIVGYSFFILMPEKPTAYRIGTAVGALLRLMLYAAIWYSYLDRSKRVKATYPPGQDIDL
ncbi:MAG: DUF2569 family protein [Elusimicrobiota bacterium]